ncbi:MAG: hypothetical protein SFY95_04150 [Planctomycetota bacterium]|nr:hypothetical protein [Planctomycetota bacterium]
MQALDLIFRAGGVILAIIVLVWLVRSRVIDRSKGRRRCPRCWYGMDGVPGLTCPECGRAAKNEHRLLRTRWRKRRLALGLIGLLAAACVFLGPEYQRYDWAKGPRWIWTASILWKRDWPPGVKAWDHYPIHKALFDPSPAFERDLLLWALPRRVRFEPDTARQDALAPALQWVFRARNFGRANAQLLSIASDTSNSIVVRENALRSLGESRTIDPESLDRIMRLTHDPKIGVLAIGTLLEAGPRPKQIPSDIFERVVAEAATDVWTWHLAVGYDGWTPEQLDRLMRAPAYTSDHLGGVIRSRVQTGRPLDRWSPDVPLVLRNRYMVTSIDARDALKQASPEQLEPILLQLLLHVAATNPQTAEWLVPIAARNGADPALIAWFVDRLIGTDNPRFGLVKLAWERRDLHPGLQEQLTQTYLGTKPWRPRMGAWYVMLRAPDRRPELLARLREDTQVVLPVIEPNQDAEFEAQVRLERQQLIRIGARAVLHLLVGEGEFPERELQQFIAANRQMSYAGMTTLQGLLMTLGPDHVSPFVPELIAFGRETVPDWTRDILTLLADLAPDDPRVRAELAWASENLDTRGRVLARALLRRIESSAASTTAAVPPSPAATPSAPPAAPDISRPAPALRP